MNVTSLLRVVLVILLVILVLTITSYFFPNLFNLDIFGFVSQPPDVGDMFIQDDLSAAAQIPSYENNYDGMVLEKDSGEDSVGAAISERVLAPDCIACSPCVNNKCGHCISCAGINDASRFYNCFGCNAGACIMCDDTGEEYQLCSDIKACIKDSYGDSDYKKAYGCLLRVIPHNDGTALDIDALLNIIKSCKDESITMDMGDGFEKEVCYFNTTSLAYYNNPLGHDFYMSVPLGDVEYLWPGLNDETHIKIKKTITPFYGSSGNWQNRYRLYIAFQGEANKDYKVWGGYYGGFLGADDTSYDWGTVSADSNGFVHGEVDLTDMSWISALEDDPSKNRFNIIKLNKSGLTIVNAMLYVNYPESNQAWTNSMRYSKCNFDTDPEPYMENNPWWAVKTDGINSSMASADDPNSSIKVYFDPNTAAGGVSQKRGNIKIQMGRFDADLQRNCKFDIYVCAQDAFAESEDQNILNIKDFFENFDENNIFRETTASTGEIMLYNYFKVKLDGTYTADEIKSAIKTGFRNWENAFPYTSPVSAVDWFSGSGNSGLYVGAWDERSGLVTYDDDCWNDGINSLMNNNDERLMIVNCNNNKCSGDVKIRVAFKYKPPTALNSGAKSPLYPAIALCSSDSAAAATVCGNGTVEGTEQCDPPIASSAQCGGLECKSNCQCATAPTPCSSYTTESSCSAASCKWCKKCESGITARRVNTWGSDKCVDSTADCGYHCDKTQCSAYCESDSDCSPMLSCMTSLRCECEL
jgi:hypothetical protein